MNRTVLSQLFDQLGLSFSENIKNRKIDDQNNFSQDKQRRRLAELKVNTKMALVILDHYISNPVHTRISESLKCSPFK